MASRGLAPAARVGVALLAAINVWSLLSVLYVGRLHPVRHELLLPSDAGLICVLSWPPLVVTVLLVATFLALARRVSRLRRATAMSAVFRDALLPAAAAPVWLVFFLPNARLGFLVVLAGILLTAWTVARCVEALCAKSETDSSEADVGGNIDAGSSPWWREGWFGVVLLIAVGLVFFHTYVQIKLYQSLQYGSPDIGYYAEMLTNVLRGRGLFCEAFGHHYFGEHVSPGLYLLVPLWACFPRIELLMLLGAGAVISGCLPVYAMARTAGGSARIAAALAIAYLLYPSTSRIIYGASYGFHEILIVLPLMLWSFHHYQRRQWRRMACMIVLALAFKENVAVIYGGFGLYVFLGNRTRWWGLALLGICILYLGLSISWIVPSFRSDGGYSKYYLYAGLGGTPVGILSSFVRDPSRVLGRLLSWQALGYTLSLCVPVALLVFKRPVILVALPTLFFTCLMDNPDFASIRFWHQSSALAVLWFAVVQAVTRAGHRPRNSRRVVSGHAVVALLCCSALTHYALGFSPVSRMSRDLPLATGDRSALIERLHTMIPEAHSVQATPRLACHFYDQDHVYPMDADPPVKPDWILLDLTDSFVPVPKRADLAAWRDTLVSGDDYELAFQDGPVSALRLRESR